MVGRNDDYGGDFKQRLQLCINWTHSLLSAHKIKAEIIFVNYNPLPETAIKNFIDWPSRNQYVTTRLITVSPELHKNLVSEKQVKDVPVLEYIAKNVGIRRAQGEYILAMNPDVLVPDSIVKKWDTWNAASYYRANRIDYEGDLGAGSFTRLFLKGHSYPFSRSKNFFYPFYVFYNKLLCLWRLNTVNIGKPLELIRLNVYTHNAEFRYHCNVSGDFLLMHSSAWGKLNSYAENTPLALHTDALMVVQAATSGLKERVFFAPVFHKEHSRRYDTKTENPEYRKAYLFFQEQAQEMINHKKLFIYNSEKWGLAEYSLPEETL